MPISRVYTKNATYQMFEVLKTNRNKRHRQGMFLVEGVRNINAALQNEWAVHSFLFPGETQLSNWAKDLLARVSTQVNYQLSRALMAEISGKTDTSELLAILSMRPNDTKRFPVSDNPMLALFDRPSNKGNLGSIIRSCDAFGIQGLLVTGHGVDPYDTEVIGSSMGSFFAVPTVRLAKNEDVHAYLDTLHHTHPKLLVLGTTAHSAETIYNVDLTRPLVWMIGSETDGLNHTFQSLCERMVTIPMVDGRIASSLNVSCAASILFAETMRQRTCAAKP